MSSTRRHRRLLLVLGLTLAAAFLALELTEPPRPEIAATGRLDAGSLPRHVRILLRQFGEGPWVLHGEDGLSLETEKGTVTGDSLTVAIDEDSVRVEGRPVGKRAVLRGPAAFTLNNKALRGSLIFDVSVGRSLPVLRLELEQYLSQVLPGEMPQSYPEAALEAQAIAARSYAVATAQARRKRSWDLTDGESSQMFAPLSARTRHARKIIARTTGLVLGYRGRVFRAYYSANCGGHTRSNKEAFQETALAPLAGVACPHCAWSRDHSWSTSLSRRTFEEIAELPSPLRRIHVEQGPGSGYTNRIICRMRNGRKEVSGATLRRRLGNRRIRSDWLVGADLDHRDVTIGGRGFGHGVGLCQNGACGMARKGSTATDILQFYYPDAELLRMSRQDQ